VLYGIHENFIRELIQFYGLLSALTSTGGTLSGEDNFILGFVRYHLYGVSDVYVVRYWGRLFLIKYAPMED
jgi:hypothetical protein